MTSFIKKTIIAFTIGLMAGTTFAHASTRMTDLKIKGDSFNRRPASIELSDPKPIPSRDIVNTGDAVFAETETFAVRTNLVGRVNQEMVHLGLEEDVDYAWVSKSSNSIVNFVCYSVDCNHWARQKLHALAKAPAPSKEDVDYRNAWKDPAIEKKEKEKQKELSEDEKIHQRQQLSYKRLKQG